MQTFLLKLLRCEIIGGIVYLLLFLITAPHNIFILISICSVIIIHDYALA